MNPEDRDVHGNKARNNRLLELLQDNDDNESLHSTTSPTERVHYILRNDNDEGLMSHPLFSEMSTLQEKPDGQMEWTESARWVKFEEDVEEGGQRWSKPYVASLSLHYLFDLRSVLQNGTVVLDLEASKLPKIADVITENMINDGHLPRETKEKVIQALLSQHNHLYEKSKRKTSRSQSIAPTESQLDLCALEKENKGNLPFMKKVPPGTEAADILIGEAKFLDNPISAFVRLHQAAPLENVTEIKVPSRFIFIMMGPKGGLPRYREIGRAMGTLLSDEVFRDVVYKVKDKKDLMFGVDEFMDSVTVLPPAEWDPTIRIEPPSKVPSQDLRKRPSTVEAINEEDEEKRLREEAGLVRTNRLFGGLMNDIKRKAPWYWSDFKDAMSMQSVATICFLYFACLAPIITFGGLLGDATGNNIAAMESLVSGLVCGVIYGFFAGQPLTILGSTGPVLVFETIVYEFCQNMGWNYLELRVWIGLWAAGILLILVAFDASSFVCYITRFTEENFATLIAVIFIVEAVEKVYDIGHKYPMQTKVDEPKFCDCAVMSDGNETVSYPVKVNSTAMEYTDHITEMDCHHMNGTLVGHGCHDFFPDVYIVSLVLFIGTFLISMWLKNFKTAPYFPTWVRNFISDFAVIIAIVLMASMDYVIGIHTPKLSVPAEFKPTNPDRGWFIPPFGHNPWWTPIIAGLPALLACILLFMDQQITTVIINRKEHKLKKGGGYHLDLLVLAALIAVNSIMGLPWFVAATVLAINHVNSLKKESDTAAPGEKPQFLGVRENRVTNIIIFLMIGGSVFMTPFLKMIPMPVLFGVFLYMGIAALGGIQFFDRIKLMFMPAKYQPDYAYLRDVPMKKVHLFTCIQIACLACLWIIKSFSQTSILFPLMLVVMIGVRKSLDKIFTQRELKILDDTLPEFKRKQKFKEQEEKKKERELNKARDLMTISLKNSNSTGDLNISKEFNKSGIWKQVSLEGNFPAPPKIPASSNKEKSSERRRKSSILKNDVNGLHNVSFVIDEDVESNINDFGKIDNTNERVNFESEYKPELQRYNQRDTPTENNESYSSVRL